eukprot:Gb_22690 [translate_table: standard]
MPGVVLLPSLQLLYLVSTFQLLHIAHSLFPYLHFS